MFVCSVACDPLGNNCAFELASYNTQTLSNSVTRRVIDPVKAGTWNTISLYRDESLNDWKDVYDHCKRRATGLPWDCPAMRSFEKLATETFPGVLNETYTADGSSWRGDKLDGWTHEMFEDMSCQLSYYLFDGWGGGGNEYINRATASWFNERWPIYDSYGGGKFTKDNLHMLGYAQWGNGIPTSLLYYVPSTTNLKRVGIWRFSKKGTQLALPEYYSRAMKWAYPSMNMTTSESEMVLTALAEHSVEAYELRRHMIDAGTTFHGGPDGDKGMSEGSKAYILENVEGDFKLEEGHKFYDVSVFLDTSYMSSATFCPIVEQQYFVCDEQVTKFKQFWPTRCSEWQTLNTDPAFGIQCNDVRIWSESHPWPKKVGNLIESMVTEMLWTETLKKGMLTCANPGIIQEPNGLTETKCSYDYGGMFIKQKARDIIFEGYTDPATIKIMNMHFEMEKRGYQIKCNNPLEISYAWQCEAIPDPQCGEKGFSVVMDDGTVLKNLTRNTRDWYLPEIDLGPVYGEIDNPVFALYLGQLWKNPNVDETNENYDTMTVAAAKAGSVSAMPNFNESENIAWQKERACAARYMGGVKGVYPNCTVVMETGRGSLEDLGRIVEYRGKRTLEIAPGGGFEVNGNALGDGAYNVFKPEKWEGFRKYDFSYMGRKEGLRFKGNDTFRVFIGDENLQFKVPNVEAFDGKNPSELFWPPRYLFNDNETRNSEAWLLR